MNFPTGCQVIKANGFESARQYRMLPNSSALILDENQPIVYLVTSDGTGYNTVQSYDITPHKSQEQVTIEDIIHRIERLENESNLTSNATEQIG